nr:hypothetical protein [Tanacetum cinerariifolium]
YFEIHDLKAQLQDKGIVISELKKLIEKLKGKSVDTKFEKSSVIRQPNAFKSQRPSVLGVILTTSVSRPQLMSNPMGDRVMRNSSQGKKQEVDDQRRSVKLSKNKTSVTAFLTPLQETPSVAPITTLPPPSVSTIPLVLLQTIAPIPTPPIITKAPTIIPIVLESDALSVVQLRVVKLEKDVSELKKIDHPTKALATLKSQVPMVVEHYLGSKIGDDL